MWRGKKYDRCTKVGTHNGGRFWCPTERGPQNTTKDSKNWGYCSDQCPKHEGNRETISYCILYDF